MTSLLQRLSAHDRAARNSTEDRASPPPQTLAEKLAQELGPEAEELSPSRLARPLSGSRSRANSADAELFATNSPQASGPHGLYLGEYEDGEERMPIPSTWREQSPDIAKTAWLGRQLRAGLLGLVLGLAGVIPAVLWLAGRIDVRIPYLYSAHDNADATGGATAVGSPPPALIVPPKAAERTFMAGATEKDNNAAAIDELISRAQGYIAEGNMTRAREILSEGALADNPKAAFALAETFDPNILAATGAQGAKAEVERARTLYLKALAGGIATAKRRLDALN